MPAVVEHDIGQGTWDGHLLLLHRDEPERRAAVAAWVRRGLELGEKIYYCEPATRAPQRQLVNLLAAACPQATAAASSGQLQVLPPAEFYPPGGQLPLIRRGLAQGYPGIRLAAEFADALTVQTVEHHNTIERAFEETGRSYPVSALCQHRTGTLAGPRLDEVVAMHLDGIRERLLHSGRAATDDDAALTLTGEIDLSNADLLASALRAITTSDRPSSSHHPTASHHPTTSHRPAVRIDLSELSYIDARGVGALARATSAYRARGGRLVLLANGRCERILRLLDVQELPNVTILGCDA